ncbi:MAG TPA: O-antigen ligase family protein [Steroidobacteraceae bacterium]|jgi:O-antigen ligase
MRYLLIVLVSFMTLSSVFDFDPGPAPGLKIKNALLYLVVMLMMLRVTIDRSYRIQLPSIPAIFSVLIGYAMLTFVALWMFQPILHYDFIANGMLLKSTLIDQMLLFLVFFYALRTDADAVLLLKALLAACALSHAVAVLDAVGIMHFGDIEQKADGRVQGMVGEANQYGAFVAMTLPAIASMIACTRGFWRLFWLGATAVTGLALVMTVSRGAFVGTVAAILLGMFLFRRYVPTRKLLMLGGAFVGCAILAIAVTFALGFEDLILGRLLGGAHTGADLEGVSSGRLEIWTNAIAVMWEKPLTLLTGYGWSAYLAMPFRLATHNHYLAHWFNLGVIGVTCAVLLFVTPVRIARGATLVASPDVRPLLIGFVVGTLAVAIAVFFVDLYLPWHYYWAYAGAMMRIAVNQTERVPVPVVAPRTRAVRGKKRDAHGWTTVTSRESLSR